MCFTSLPWVFSNDISKEVEKSREIQKTLILLSRELARKKPNKKKLEKLLKEAQIPIHDDPFMITNEVLKRLHPYYEK